MRRIVIAGRFISDVSITINNTDSSFDIDQTPSVLGWNPAGRRGCSISTIAASPARLDPAGAGRDHLVLALAVSGAADRPSAKMVDLDPDWYMSSEASGPADGPPVRSPDLRSRAAGQRSA